MFGYLAFGTNPFADDGSTADVTAALTGQSLTVSRGTVTVVLPIVNNVGTSVSDLGGNSYRITKVSGGFAYNADAVGTVGYTGDFLLRLSPASTFSGNWIGGMNTDPLTDSDYASIDYGLLSDGTNWFVFESGANIGSSTPHNTFGWIWRSGTTLNYGTGATFGAASASPIRTVTSVSATLYFDSAFANDGTITDIQLTDTVPVVLSGQALTVAAGSLAVQSSLALAGQALTAGRGTLAGQTSLAVTGQSATAAQGNTTANLTLALTGQALSVARGSVVAVGGDVNVAITGQSLSVARGTVLNATDKALTGQANTAAAGSVVAQTALAITGQALTAARGSLAITSILALTGQSTTAAQGPILGATGLALTGQSTTVARGSLLATTSLSLAGQSIIIGQGTASASNDVIAALTGLTLSATLGNVTVAVNTVTVALTGQQLGIATGTLAANTNQPAIGLAQLDARLRRSGGSWKDRRMVKTRHGNVR